MLVAWSVALILDASIHAGFAIRLNALLDLEAVKLNVTDTKEVFQQGACKTWAYPERYCSQPKDEKILFWRSKLLGNKLASAGSLIREERADDEDRCVIIIAQAKTNEEAAELALGCCVLKAAAIHKSESACEVVGANTASSMSRNCALHNGEAGPTGCTCPEDAPHILQTGDTIIRRVSNAPRLSFQPDEQKVCVDECFANSMSGGNKNIDLQGEWPVVFLAVYKLGGPIVHSNLAFCPSAKILEGSDRCMQPGVATCSNSVHNKVFAEGHSLPELLVQHGCFELIYDGNGGGGVWMPPLSETGCWGQGASAKDFFWQMGNRRSTGYGKLYWLTSDNIISPYAVKTEMESCFSSKLGHRLDFNPNTYALLHHNCNKFSTEVMRFMELPRFASADDKGRHSEIAFSATDEESTWRRWLRSLTGSLIGHDRSQLSLECESTFFEKVPNCRRVFGGGRKGDCPTSSLQLPLRCYDPTTGGIAKAVGYQDRPNGVCAITEGETCSILGLAGPCQPGSKCVPTETGALCVREQP